MELYEQLMAYEPFNKQEERDRLVILSYLQQFDDIFERTNEDAHMTSSPWIINSAFTHVLMIYHNIYDSWSWCGGHSDGEKDLLKNALKEGKEETGLVELEPLAEDIFSLEVLEVKPHWKHGQQIKAHKHLNITYLCVADEHALLRYKPDENSGVRWIALEEIDHYVKEKAMLEIYHKLIKKQQLLLKERSK